MCSILVPGITPNHPIELQTRLGNDIENSQDHGFSISEQNLFQAFDRRFPKVEVRALETPIYNCHGLTFASRRTRIWRNDAINLILADDGYVEIKQKDIMPGDVIMYFDNQGDFEHSGIVVYVDEHLHFLEWLVNGVDIKKLFIGQMIVLTILQGCGFSGCQNDAID